MARKATKKKPTAKKAPARPSASRKPAPPKASAKSAKKPQPAATAPKKKPEPKKPKVAEPKKTARKAVVSDNRQTAEPKARTKPSGKPATRRGRDKKSRKFRQILLERHRSLVQAYASSKDQTRDIATDGTEDYIDYAVSSYDRDFSLSLNEMERRRIRLVEEALKRIDRGEYGNCMQCGQEIPEKRLEVEPWARHCVRCQELEEQGLLQQRAFETDYDEDEVLEEAEEILEPDDEPEEAGGDDAEGGEIEDGPVDVDDDDEEDDEEVTL
jgi:DnaK suppressor protein